MSTPDRMDPALQGGDSAVSDARAEREQRLGETEAQLAAGAHPGHDQQTTYHQGAPSVQEQMQAHVPPPHIPDVGGHDSPSAHIG